MQECNSVETPTKAKLKPASGNGEASTDATLFRQIVDNLRFICQSRPEIAYSVAVLEFGVKSSRDFLGDLGFNNLEILRNQEAYAPINYPVNGHLQWEKTSCPDILSPLKRKMPGRPKKKKKNGAMGTN
ncbi:hypothetical protein V8G54_035220 [Vigna mungo]|uniref:Uncharacterized protein n=1 Tax=Vigna mungo TaxID=3915 RepID=A0AAQ3MEP0_VIGMU